MSFLKHLFLKRWQWFLAGILISFFVSVVAIDWKLGKSPSVSQKGIEIFDARIVGYSGQQRVWRVRAERVWSGYSHSLFNLESVSDGQFCNPEGRVVLDGLSSPQMRVNSRLRMLSVDQGMRGIVRGKEEGDSLVVSSEHLRYVDSTKEVVLSGGVRMVHGDMVILPKDRVVYTVSGNEGVLTEGGVMESPEFWVSANRIMLRPDEQVVLLENGAQGKRKSLTKEEIKTFKGDPRELSLRQKPTKFSSDRISYSLKNGTNDVRLLGNIKVFQPDKSLMADSGIYRRKDRTFSVSGNVTFSTSSLTWMQDKRRKKTIQNLDFKQAMNESLVMKSRALDMDFVKHSFVSSGGVVITQPQRRVLCDEISYRDEDQVFFLEGNVKVFRKKDTLNAESMNVDALREEVGAQEGVDTTFSL